MTGYAVIVSEAVHSTMADIVEYLYHESGSEEVVEAWARIMDAAITSLSEWPRRARLVDARNEMTRELRQMVVGDYLLIYQVRDDTRTVVVTGLRHGRRRPESEVREGRTPYSRSTRTSASQMAVGTPRSARVRRATSAEGCSLPWKSSLSPWTTETSCV